MEGRIARMQKLVGAVREIRNHYTVDPKTAVDVTVKCRADISADFQTLAPFITQLAGVGKLECGPNVAKPPQAAGFVGPDFEAYVSGVIDVPAELKRLEKQLAEKLKFLQTTQAKLDNPNFRDRAPAEVVQQERDRVVELQKQIATLEANIKELREGAA
jgi:valyl-tRNA synthetase